MTPADLKKRLHYDAETGVFTRLIGVKGGGKAGTVAGSRRKDGYVRICINGRAYLAHRLAWLYMRGEWPSASLDHRDGNPTNNRLDNLRIATQPENMANAKRHADNSSGYKGVVPRKGGWRAQISKDGKRIYLGLFATKEAAAEAYREAAERLFGSFARPE